MTDISNDTVMKTNSDTLVEKWGDHCPVTMEEDTASVANNICVSGIFIRLAQEGRLPEVMALISKHRSLQDALTMVEVDLQNCNNPMALTEFAKRCSNRKLDFVIKLKDLAANLELKKVELRTSLNELEQQLAREGFKALVRPCPGTFLSSQPRFMAEVRRGTSGHTAIVAARNAVIDRCVEKGHSNLETCKSLDLELAAWGMPRELPKSWVVRYKVKSFTEAYRNAQCRNLVHRLINERRKALKLRRHALK